MARTLLKKAELGTIIHKSTQAVVAITLSNYRNRTRVDVREYYVDEDTGDYGPTQRGVQIPPDEFGNFMKALAAFEKKHKKDLEK